MATTINADTVVGGAIVSGDATGILGLQAAGNTLVTLNGNVVSITAGLLTDDSATIGGTLSVGGTLTAPSVTVTNTLIAGALTLDGTAVTATASELNKLDGVTVGATEFNYLTGVTGNIQPQINAITLTPNVIAADTNAVAGNRYFLDSAGITLTLPATPSTGDLVGVSEVAGDNTHIIARNGSNIMSDSADLTFDIAFANFVLTYTGPSVGWAFSG